MRTWRQPKGILAVETIAGKNPRPINYDHVPGCTYCQPEVASVGLTEAKARERGYDVKVGHFPIPVIAKSQILGATEGMVKIVSDARYDELLGVHLIGPHATELIAEGVRRASDGIHGRRVDQHHARASDRFREHARSFRRRARNGDSRLSQFLVSSFSFGSLVRNN